MKNTYYINYTMAENHFSTYVNATDENAAMQYLKIINPKAYIDSCCPYKGCCEAEGIKAYEAPESLAVYPRLTTIIFKYYEAQADKFWQDLNNITTAEATDHSYYSRTTTPKLYEAIKALPQGQPLPDWAKDKMLAKFQRLNNKERAKKLQKLADVASLSPLESVTVNVEWKRNPTWGHNPAAEVRAFGDGYGAKLTVGKASGCGYDKESAAIATAMNGNLQILRAMYDHAERGGSFPYSVYTYAGLPYFDGGCGVSCFRNVFEAMGYKWHDVAHGKTYDVYSVERA